MSYHRENVTWQSADGTWNRGFYETYSTGWSDDDEYDSEWDDECNMDAFDWVSTGHTTEEGARRAWDGANPGGTTIIRQPQTDAERAYWDGESDRLDDMAAKLWIAEIERSRPQRYSWERSGIVNGTPKRRVPRYLAKDVADAQVNNAHYDLDGYDNVRVNTDAQLEELRSRYEEMTPDERAQVEQVLLAGVKRIQDNIGEALDRSRGYRTTYPRMDRIDLAKARVTTLSKLAKEAGAKQRAPRTAKPTAAAGRGKTTAASTSGSFAPKSQSAPDITL